jgi:histidinol-phosphate aminotransferase
VSTSESTPVNDALPLVRGAVRAMSAYVPGLQPGPGERVVKLNTNENPYPPSPRALRALRAAAGSRLRLYPDPVCRALRERAAAVYGLDMAQVVPGNGSDELLAIVMRTFVDEGGAVAYFQPSYSLYPVLAAAARARVVEVPLPRDAAGLAVPRVQACEVFFLSTPNAPYGTGFSTAWIEELLASFAGIVVADEAYAEFADETSLPLLARHPRLVIVRTLSKSHSLAGLRVGLAFAHPGVAAEMAKVKDSYNLDRPAQAAAAAALADQAHFRRNRDRIRATRARFSARIADLGFAVPPSQANFVFAAVGPGMPAARELYAGLRERGFLVRFFDRPGLDDGMRITIGTDAEMDALARTLAGLVGR